MPTEKPKKNQDSPDAQAKRKRKPAAQSRRPFVFIALALVAALVAPVALELTSPDADHSSTIASWISHFTSPSSEQGTQAAEFAPTVVLANRSSLQLRDVVHPANESAVMCCGVRLLATYATDADGTPYVQYVTRSDVDRICGSAKPLAWDRVDDGMCDCDDGSDEVTTGACSQVAPLHRAATILLSAAEEVQSFTCLLDGMTVVAPSRLRDGVQDCCDGSDEGLFPPSPDAQARCRKVHQDRRAAATQKLETAQAGHREYLARCKRGSNEFGPEFNKNISLAIQEVQRSAPSVDAIILNVTQELQNQLEVRVAQITLTNPDMPPEEFAKLRKQEERQMQMALKQYTAQVRRQVKQRENEIGARQALVQTKALGAQFEYYPLYGACIEATIHEKQLKGGSAIPEQYHVRFQVCPFQYLLQQTLTPEFESAVEELASHEIQMDIGGYFAIPEAGQRDPSIPPVFWDRLTELRRIVRATLLGVWSGFTTVNKENQVVVSRTADNQKDTAASKSNVQGFRASAYTHGEPCPLLGGKPREGWIRFECGLEDTVVHVEELGLCEYAVVMASPSACDEKAVQAKARDVVAADVAEKSFLAALTNNKF